MASTSPTFPGTGANVDNAGGNSWISTSNVSADDNARAQISTTAGVATDYLWCTNFNFSAVIGASDTIDGIVVDIERANTLAGSNTCTDNTVQLIVGGSLAGSNKASGTAWPSTQTVATYGTSTDLWGLSLTAADVRDTNFGVALAVVTTANNGGGVQVDYFKMTVHYTAAGSAGQPQSKRTITVPFLAGTRRVNGFH